MAKKQLTQINEGGNNPKTYSKSVQDIAQSGISDSLEGKYPTMSGDYLRDDYGISSYKDKPLDGSGDYYVKKSGSNKPVIVGQVNLGITPTNPHGVISGVYGSDPMFYGTGKHQKLTSNQIQANKEVEAKAKWQKNNPGMDIMQ